MSLKNSFDTCKRLFKDNLWTIKEKDGLPIVSTPHAELLVKQLAHAHRCLEKIEFSFKNLNEIELMIEFYRDILNNCQRLEQALIQPSFEFEVDEYKKKRANAIILNQTTIQYIKEEIENLNTRMDRMEKKQPPLVKISRSKKIFNASIQYFREITIGVLILVIVALII